VWLGKPHLKQGHAEGMSGPLANNGSPRVGRIDGWSPWMFHPHRIPLTESLTVSHTIAHELSRINYLMSRCAVSLKPISDGPRLLTAMRVIDARSSMQRHVIEVSPLNAHTTALLIGDT